MEVEPSSGMSFVKERSFFLSIYLSFLLSFLISLFRSFVLSFFLSFFLREDTPFASPFPFILGNVRYIIYRHSG